MSAFRRSPLHGGWNSEKQPRRWLVVIASLATGVGVVLSTAIRFAQHLHGQKQRLGWWRFLLRMAGWGAGVLALYLLFLWITLPSLDRGGLHAHQSSVITDRNGVELYRLYDEEDRREIPGEQIPLSIRHAIVAIEDERFYERGCMDFRALARAFLRFGQSGGASTLTRQLARNALNLKQQNIINRKLKELILGCQLEWTYEKERLLELYLNWIPFGENAYGVEQASQRYFGISAKDLTLAQSVVLASLPQRPTYFSPYGRHVRTSVSEEVIRQVAEGEITSVEDIPDEEISIGLLAGKVGSGNLIIGGRTDQVLQNMLEQGYITEEERTKALADLQKITFQPSRENIRAPYFILWVRDQLEDAFGETAESGLLEQGGLTIRTTLDWELQQIAEKVVERRRSEIVDRFGAHNISLVALDAETREVLAYVGNSDFTEDENGKRVDMAQAPRAPGSSFKPIVYAAAFQEGYNPATVLYDVPTKFGDDQPANYDNTFWGLTTMRGALGGSRNIPAIKTYFLAGEESPILQLASRLGVSSPLRFKEEENERRRKDGRDRFEYGWPLALGSGEVPLVEMVQGYGSIAGGGRYIPMKSIQEVQMANGALFSLPTDDREEEEVLDPRIAYQITSILTDVSARPGEFWQAALSVPGTEAAAKTGTSNDCFERDPKGVCKIRKPNNTWTMGYTPEIVVGVWVGNATNAPLTDKADGLNAAAPIWKEFLTNAIKVRKPKKTAFDVPSNIVQPQVSLLSGELPTECTPVHMRRADVFLSERAPTELDPACTRVLVDKPTGLLASERCPVEAQEERSFFFPRSEIRGRPALEKDWNEGISVWMQSLAKQAAGSGALTFTLAPPPTEECDARSTPERLIKPTLTLRFPDSGDTAPYPAFQPQIDFTVGSRVQEVTFEIDGKTLAKLDKPPFQPTLRIPRSIDENGLHTMTVTLTDDYYNKVTTSSTFTFSRDVAAPTVRVERPFAGSSLQAGTELEMVADASAPSGIKYVEFYLDELLLTRKPNAPYAFSYPLVSIMPGVHRVRAVAVDFGQRTSEDSVEFTVEERQ